MTGTRGVLLKFGIFGVIMIVLTAFLFLIFGQYRTGSTNGYSAVFTDVSGLNAGDSVRAGGLRVGTVENVSMRPDHTAVVTFDVDPVVPLSSGTKAAVRYLNLVGDRFLELVDGPGSTRLMPKGGQIPVDRTTPALDLDLLVGGLKPVIQGLNPQDVNALTAALLQVFQGQGGTLESLLSETSAFTNGLADNSQVIQQLIDSLNNVVGTLADNGNQLAGTIDRFERLVTGLAADRNPIGSAIESLDSGTASLADLLGKARPPLAGTINQLSRLAPEVDDQKALIEASLQRAPDNYRRLVRLGSYGSWINYYICELSVRVSDLQGRTAVFPFIKQDNGRCTE